jgi:outer membrane protein assembly factor BamB
MKLAKTITVILALIVQFSVLKAQVQKEWPAFHGIDRSNRSSETGLADSWPAGGPKLIWTAGGLTEGYSSAVIGEGLIFTAGKTGDKTSVFAFDKNGKLIWVKPNGDALKIDLSWATTYTGPRSTPTYDKGVVYHLGEKGRLAAFNAKTGEEIWSKDLLSEYGAKIPEYGYAESVLIDGDKLFVRPIGTKGYQVCLDKKSGKQIWANNEIGGAEAYVSGVLMNFGGYRQVVGASSDRYYGVDVNSGKLLWTVDCRNELSLNSTDAVIVNDHIFISSAYGKGSMLVKLTEQGGKIIPTVVWQSDLMDNHHGGVLYDKGYIYGSGSNSRGWFCIEMLTGRKVWNNTQGKGSITYADGKLFLLDERGSMKMIRASEKGFELLGSFNVPKGGEGMYWAHPVVCDGRLYIRHSDKLYAYSLR